MAEQDPFPPGSIVADKYRVISPLSRGGYGAVYVAEHIEVGQRVALKALLPHMLHNEKAIKDFKFEARVYAKVKSKYLVQVHDAGVDPRTQAPFLVMELLQGTDLRHLVRDHGPVAPRQVAGYLTQVAAGLDKAHGYVDEGRPTPIVHRDLKPENLFVAEIEREDEGKVGDGGKESIVKILDFGIAKVVSESGESTRQISGTTLFMAYEQATGGKITRATDIWSFGLIAFYLLTGRYYWLAAQGDEGSIAQIFAEILTMPLVAPRRRAREIGAPVVLPSAFDRWFLRCVRRDASERFQSAGEAARELTEILASEAAPLPAPRGRSPSRKMLIGATAGIGLLAAGIVVVVVQMKRPSVSASDVAAGEGDGRGAGAAVLTDAGQATAAVPAAPAAHAGAVPNARPDSAPDVRAAAAPGTGGRRSGGRRSGAGGRAGAAGQARTDGAGGTSKAKDPFDYTEKTER